MNKKLLKSVAALFAVAVLGVSCSNNSTTPEKETVTVDKTDYRPTLQIFPKSPEKTSVVGADITQVITASSKAFASQATTAVKGDLIFVGADASSISLASSNPSSGVKVEIVNIKGLADGVTIKDATTDSIADINFLTDDLTLSGANDAGFILTAESGLDKIGQDLSSASKKLGIEVTLRFTDVKGEKRPVEIPVYVQLVGKDN